MKKPTAGDCKLVTIVCEAALEATLLRDLESLGARGYTVSDVRGKGGGGPRDAVWRPDANIRVEVLCDERTAAAISQALQERYYDDYSMVLFLADVAVLRPLKFGSQGTE